MKRIAVDMDEVIADAVAEHLLRYNRDHDEKITKDDLSRQMAVGRRRRSNGIRRWRLISGQKTSFEVLEVMPEAQRVLLALQSKYEIFIATAAMEVPTSFVAKFRWLERNFPFISPSHIVFCGDKSILKADFLIDDNPRQLQAVFG